MLRLRFVVNVGYSALCEWGPLNYTCSSHVQLVQFLMFESHHLQLTIRCMASMADTIRAPSVWLCKTPPTQSTLYAVAIMSACTFVHISITFVLMSKWLVKHVHLVVARHFSFLIPNIVQEVRQGDLQLVNQAKMLVMFFRHSPTFISVSRCLRYFQYNYIIISVL